MPCPGAPPSSKQQRQEQEPASATPCSSKASLYGVLGVSIKASAEEIRLSYLRLARLWHPDRHFGDDDAKRKFQQVQCAYEVLSNPMRRQHYDLQWLELLDVEDYLSRFSDFILTANGLGMSLSAEAAGGAPRRAAGSTARGVGPAAKHLGGRGWQALCQASLKAA